MQFTYMFQDYVSLKGHLQSKVLCSIGEAVFLDGEAFGVALLNSEDPSGEGDVLELHIMKKGPQMNTEQSVLCTGN